jgi:RNA 2',3'-cyclic 3'-phosphodiesterase
MRRGAGGRKPGAAASAVAPARALCSGGGDGAASLSMIRAFVAIPVPEDVAAALQALQAGLPAGRAVPPENFHLTLAFLGENPAPVIEDVHYALDAIDAPAFALTLQGLGLFGGKAPRSLHAEARPEPALAHLRARVAEAARGAGIDLPRSRFQPHVTIARFGAGLGGEDLERLRRHVAARAGFSAGPFPVRRFALVRSRLGRSGAAYEDMAVYALGPER